MQLSQSDMRILNHISLHGMPSSRAGLAKKLRMHPSTLAYRLRKLEAKGVIVDYRHRLNFLHLGFTSPAWLFLALSHRNLDLEALIEQLISRPEVHIALFLTGKYDIALKVYCRSMEEITRLIYELENELKDCVTDVSSCFITKTMKLHDITLPKKTKRKKLRRTDYRILKHRTEKPRDSISATASALSLHRNTVASRWQSLLDRGVVMKYTPLIAPDYHKDVGTAFKALVFFDALPGCATKLAKKLASLKEVHELDLVSFPHNILAVVRTADVSSFYEFHRRISPKTPISKLVKGVLSFVVLRSLSHKHNYLSELGESALLNK